MKSRSTLHIFHKGSLAAVITAALIALCLWWAYVNFMPKPLGDGLEYVGATHSGTIPLLSDSNPSTSYYYATDMTPSEVVTYFKHATIDDVSDLNSNNDPSIPISFTLTAPHTNNPLNIYYYTEGAERIREFHLKKSAKEHLIIIQNEDYQAAKDSL